MANKSLTSFSKFNKQIQIDKSLDTFITEFGKSKLEDGYLASDESSAQEVFARVATALGDDEAHAQRLYDYMAKLWFMPATPILANAGRETGLGISCYLNYVDDSVEGLTDHLKESMVLTVIGGGVGGYHGHVRSTGEKAKNGNASTGAMAWMTPLDKLPIAAAQGTTRRGAYAAYMDVNHPEIEAFLETRNPTGGDQNLKCLNIHIGVNLTDAFMASVMSGDDWALVDPHSKEVKKTIKARDLWLKIIKTRMKTGEPYLHFVDTANRALPQPLKDKGLQIHGSNLCVAPETPILTKYGYKPVQDLENLSVDVWNGLEWSEVVVNRTGVNKKLIRVHFNDGSSIDCTPEHKFYVQEDYHRNSKVFEAKDLYSGAKIEKHDLPVDTVLPTKELIFAYDQGFYSGDGNEGYTFSWIYDPKKEVISRLQKGSVTEFDNNGRARWLHGVMDSKYSVPFDYSLASRLDWLAGLLDADGCVTESENAQCIQLSSVKTDFLRQIKLMLQEMGVTSSVLKRSDEGYRKLPLNDGSDLNGDFFCQEVWMLNINTSGTKRLIDLGLDCARLKLNKEQNPQRDASRFVQVTSVEDTGRISDTFCATEPKRNKLVFNGILTGNCIEIHLPTSKDRTAVCCLSSVNLEKYDEWKNDELFIEDIMRLLDNNLTHFIDNAPISLWRAVNSARSERSVGLGAFGFHGLLMSRGIPFESAMAKSINLEVFKTLKEKTDAASLKLGVERGEAPDMLGSGHRFAHRMAVAPNASNATICGEATPSIEPIAGNVFKQMTKAGTFIVVNKHLDALLRSKYIWKFTSPVQEGLSVFREDLLQDVYLDIAINEGSVQHLDWMDPNDKDVFKTAIELDQMWLIEHASTRAPYICQGQSLNLFFEPDADINVISRAHLKAWSMGVKGLYYLRSRAINRPKRVTTDKETLDTTPRIEYNNKASNEEELVIGSNDSDSGCSACEG